MRIALPRIRVIPACDKTDRRTDRHTGGIVVASTALVMRALRRAVKTVRPMISVPVLSECDVGVLWPNDWMDHV